MTPTITSRITLDPLAAAPSETELQKAARTQDVIRTYLESVDSLKKYGITTFLHGSYKNRTNVRQESDVDIGIYSPVMYFWCTDGLADQELQKFNDGWQRSSLSYEQYREDVLTALRGMYGNAVHDGNKAIKIEGTSYRLPADVLPCVEYRRYWRYTGQRSDYTEGIAFKDKAGTLSANYPDQHYNRLVEKNDETGGYLKDGVRILKRLRLDLIEHGFLREKDAPQCYIEGLLSNVPSHLFGNGYEMTMQRVLRHLHADLEAVIVGTSNTGYTQANGILKLFYSDFWSAELALALVKDYEALIFDI